MAQPSDEELIRIASAYGEAVGASALAEMLEASTRQAMRYTGDTKPHRMNPATRRAALRNLPAMLEEIRKYKADLAAAAKALNGGGATSPAEAPPAHPSRVKGEAEERDEA